MGSIGAPEILVILVVALLVLGPDRLPDAARQVGRVLAELRRMSSGFQAELRDAMAAPVPGSPAGAVDGSPSLSSTEAAGASPGASANGSPDAEARFRWSDLPSSPDVGEPPAAQH